MPNPRVVACMLSIGTLVLAAGLASGQSYPNRPIRAVTAAVGGGNDFVARVLAHGLTASLGQQVIVDNRGGTNIAPQTVAKATPNGYTILVHNTTPYGYLRSWTRSRTTMSRSSLRSH